MAAPSLSLKQISSIADCTSRINVWIGAIRSGKTFSSILALIHFIQSGPPGDIMIVGVSRGTIQRNIVEQMYSLLGWAPPPEGKNSVKIYGRNIYFIGAKDERAVSVIYGSTLAAAYIDEIPKIPKPVFKTVLDRCSVPQAKIFGTGNPEGPRHWFKTEYLENPDLNLTHFKFNLKDNPSLDPDYIKNICKENTGVWYKRLILGEWASAEGMIYDSFNDDNLYEGPHEKPPYYIAGVDYGTSNATSCVVAAVFPYQFPKLRIVSEYYYDSKKSGRCKTDSEYANEIFSFLTPYSNLTHIYLDPSALSLRTEMQRKNMPVYDANNDVLPGIKTVAGLIFNKQIVINRICHNLIDSIYSYTWDEKASAKGTDAPRKEFDHGVDSLRYGIYSHFPEGDVSNERESWTVEKWRREMNESNPMQLLHGGIL